MLQMYENKIYFYVIVFENFSVCEHILFSSIQKKLKTKKSKQGSPSLSFIISSSADGSCPCICIQA